MVNFKNMVYKVYNKLLPADIMSYFKTINACHNHNARMKNCNFSVKGTKMWNDISGDIKLYKSKFTLKKCTKLYFCNLINFDNSFCFISM